MEYTVRRSDRARRVRVTVEADGGVVVVLPRRAAERHAAAAVQELAPWIERRRSEVAATRAAIDSRRDGTLPFLGETLTLRPEAGRTRVHRRADVLLVPHDQEQRQHALELWYRRQAAKEIAPRLDAACATAGLRYSKLTIRAQKTRWGSCSSTGAMSFNWRLLLGPPEILDYVVWHEVCHLAVMDHSPRFWNLLARYRPGYPAERRWLARNGATLVL